MYETQHIQQKVSLSRLFILEGIMFEEIKKKYPKAWDMFEQFMYCHLGEEHILRTNENTIKEFIKVINSKLPLEILSGWLFRFFDEQGIYIEIYSIPNPREYMYMINRNWDRDMPNLKTRQEAEQAAFTKAFEILEGK